MGKRTRHNVVHETILVTPPPQKTWKTPSYRLERFTIHRYVHVVRVQLDGGRGHERLTESISFALIPGVADSELVRAAAWLSPNKWTVAFGMNVSQFRGTFSHAVDARLIHALIDPPGSSYSQQLLLQQTIPPMPQSSFPPQLQLPLSQPGQFQQVTGTNNPSSSPGGRSRNMLGWYHTKSRNAKVGIGCGAIIALLLFISVIGAAIGSTQPPATATPTPANQQAGLVVTATGIVTHQTTRPTMTVTAKPQSTNTPQSKPTVQSTASKPTPHPPTPTPCPGINCNPWGYTFSPGNTISNPPSNFCDYFNCIPSFWGSDDPDNGYIVQCSDGMYSQSGGERGACSSHGGVSRTLYSH